MRYGTGPCSRCSVEMLVKLHNLELRHLQDIYSSDYFSCVSPLCLLLIATDLFLNFACGAPSLPAKVPMPASSINAL